MRIKLLFLVLFLISCEKAPIDVKKAYEENRKKNFEALLNSLSPENQKKFKIAFSALFIEYGKESIAEETHGLSPLEIIKKAESCSSETIKQAKEIVKGLDTLKQESQ